jgi:hypothetical protein
MHGALDESDAITVDMIEATAAELAEDLRGIGPAGGDTDSAPSGNSTGGQLQNQQLPSSGVSIEGFELAASDQRLLGHLAARLNALEAKMAQREQVFQRLASLFGGGN